MFSISSKNIFSKVVFKCGYGYQKFNNFIAKLNSKCIFIYLFLNNRKMNYSYFIYYIS